MKILTTLLFLSIALFAQNSDPLPSWNNGASKKSIVSFVKSATDKKSSDYVDPADRIATFDNDGTLWSEQPAYFQLFFIFDRVKELAPSYPEWKDEQPYKAVLEHDMGALAKGGMEGLLKLLSATSAGMSEEEFASTVKDWIATAKHPKTGKLYTEMVFQPMLELLDYLRDNEFKTYIVSGGGIDFMRPWVDRIYGIPPEQVVGSQGNAKFSMADGKAVVIKEPGIFFVDDKGGKPVGISRHIGKRPIAAFGNSDGDLQMLQYTAAGEGQRLMLYVHHTDAKREWEYDRKSQFGKLDKGLDYAKEHNWTVVDMKNEWKVIYPFESK